MRPPPFNFIIRKDVYLLEFGMKNAFMNIFTCDYFSSSENFLIYPFSFAQEIRSLKKAL